MSSSPAHPQRERRASRGGAGNLTGPLLLLDLIGLAQLTSTQKLVLSMYTRFADGNGESWPSISTIANRTGYATNTVSGVLTDLQNLGVVTFPNGRSKGGRAESGRACTSRVRISFDRLRELNPNRGEGLTTHRAGANPSADDAQPQSRMGANPSPGCDKETIGKDQEQTTTTTNDGGGGGGTALRSGGEEEERSAEQTKAIAVLTEHGVSLPKAQSLVATISPDVILAAPEWMTQFARNAKSPSGLMVKVLENGTVGEWHRHQEEEEARRAQAQITSRRTAAYDRLGRTIQTIRKAEDQSFVDWQFEVISAVWGSAAGLAEAAPIPDEQIFDESIDPWVLFNRLVRLAGAEAKTRGIALPPRPDESVERVPSARPPRPHLVHSVVPPQSASELPPQHKEVPS